MAQPRPGEENGGRGYAAWGLVLVILVATALVRVRSLDVPLERDEGEYAYAGQLLLHGIPPYVEAYNMKLPGTYAAYAMIMGVFGQTIRGIHLGLLLVNGATIILVFLIGRRVHDSYAGAAAAAAYALLSVGEPVLGIFAHSEHFVVLPALGGILLLLCATESDRRSALFWSGVLLGVAFVMKQHGILFSLFGFLFVLWSEWNTRPIQWARFFLRNATFLSGAILPFGVVCLLIAGTGHFERFWFWTFQYAREYASRVPFSGGLYFLKIGGLPILQGAPFCLLGAIGLIAPFWDRKARHFAVFVAGFAFFSFLAVVPGFFFRDHYFVLFLPAVALLIGIAVSAFRRLLAKRLSPFLSGTVIALLFIAALGQSIFQQRFYLFEATPLQISRMIYGANPFPESVEVAKYIRDRTTSEDRIVVLGSEPQIYFYSDRRSATGYIYTYSLMERQKYTSAMQREMIREMEEGRPKYIVIVSVETSWLKGPQSETTIFDWMKQYIQGFERVGIVDILPEQTRYFWDDEAARELPKSKFFLLVFKRKSEA